MLPGAGLRDDPRFAHPRGEHALTDAVVDFVRAGVQQVFALEVNARPAEVRGEPGGKLQGRGPPGEVAQQAVNLPAEGRVIASGNVCGLELLEGTHQSLGHIAAPVRAKTATSIGPSLLTHLVCGAQANAPEADSAASMNSRSFTLSLRPGADSTPLETSTAAGRAERMASATLSGRKPPASTMGP